MRTAFMIAIVLSFTAAAQGDTINVPGDQPTIQAGVSAAASGDTVLVAPGTYYENIDFLGKAVTVKSDQGAALTVIDGGQAGSVVSFQSGETLDAVLEGFTITNGAASEGGGIYCKSASPTIIDNIITGNTAMNHGMGGGIYGQNLAAPKIRNNTVTNNAAGYGAGICCRQSSPEILENTISNNTATYEAGGIRCKGALCTPTISDNTITGNTATLGGGILCYAAAAPSITDNQITGNLDGGGIYCMQSSPFISMNNISNNTDTGIAVDSDSSPVIEHNTIAQNTGAYNGGGIYCMGSGSIPTIQHNTITGNSASNGGGIMCRLCPAAVRIRDNTITENSATNGGGIHLDRTSLLVAENIISNNTAKNYGGGIFCEEGAPEIRCNLVSGNQSGSWGGGISCNKYDCTARMMNNLITGNSAGHAGGGLYCSQSRPRIIQCTFHDNDALHGGAICAGSINAHPFVTNTILWGDQAATGKEIAVGDVVQGMPTVTIQHSDVEGGESQVYVKSGCVLNWGPGMLDGDPLFVDPAGGDFHLCQDPCQPGVTNLCVDAGDNLAANMGMNTCWTRTDGVADGGMVDMGYHYGPCSPPVLGVDTWAISQSAGGAALFSLSAGVDRGDRSYFLLGSISGTEPGTPLPGGLVTLPLNWDIFTGLVFRSINTPFFSEFQGALDGAGSGAAELNTYGPMPPAAVGVTMHFAYLLYSPFDFVSNTVAVEIVN